MKTLFFAFLFAVTAQAQDFTFDKEKGRAVPSFIGQLKLVKGKVFKKLGEDFEEVGIGSRFGLNDTLITQENSFARIEIVDDTVISVGPKSELKFSDFDFTDKDTRHIVFTFLKGQMSGHVKNKAKEGDITFKTKLTAMGVRGTQILINHQTQKNLEVSEFALLSGKAAVNNTELAKGERIIFIKDSMTQKSASEKINLTGTEMRNMLSADDPLMDYFRIADITQTSSLYPVIKKVDSETPEEVQSEKREDEKASWRDNLKKLNEKLKENQKRR